MSLEKDVRKMFGRTKTQLRKEQVGREKRKVRTIDEFEAKHKKLKRIAFSPSVVKNIEIIINSKFGGIPITSEKNPWPICPNCKKNMQFYLQIDSRELDTEFSSMFGEGILQVFHCGNEQTDCENECEAYLPFSQSTKVRIIPLNEIFLKVDKNKENCTIFKEYLIHSWNKKEVYPDYDDLHEIGVDITRELNAILYKKYSLDGDNLGGYPLWVQEPIHPKCRSCKRNMSFIFQIDTDSNIKHDFPNIGYMYIFGCSCNKGEMTVFFSCT